MIEPRCKNCAYFTKWSMVNNDPSSRDPEGVCTAPRTLLGPQPEREVRGSDGRNCPMWADKKDTAK